MTIEAMAIDPIRSGSGETALMRAARATRLDPTPPQMVPSSVRRVAGVAGDVLVLLGIVLCVPFVILAIGIPIALCVRLLVWIGGML